MARAWRPDDARLALERHATSKIAQPGRSRRHRTLGFRGEALPSIASVSHFMLRTRARGAREPAPRSASTAATIVSVREAGAPDGHHDRGRRPLLQPAGAPQVPQVRCRGAAQISRLVTQMALGYPEVGFTLTSGGPRLLRVPAGGGAARALLSAVRRPRRTSSRCERRPAGCRSTDTSPRSAIRVRSAARRTSS